MSLRSEAARPVRPEIAVGLVVEQLRRVVPGGIGTYTTGLLRGLLALDEHVRPGIELVASRSGQAIEPLAAFGLPLRTSRLPGIVLTRLWSIGAAPLRGYPLVHSTSLDVPATTGVLVLTVHDLLWREFPEAYGRHGRAWHEAALRRAARRAQAFVVPSAAVRDALLGAGVGIGAAQVSVIEEGADHLLPADDAATVALLESLGVRGEYLLSVGTLEPRKNLARLFSAYASVCEQLAGRPPLIVCGPEGWGEELRMQPPAGVLLAGRVPDAVLTGLYERAAALVHVPLGEGFGLPVIEAMAAGTPVIASPQPSSGGATFEVDPRDETAIAAAIVSVLGDREARDRLIAAGRRRVESLTWKGVAAAHVALWDALQGTR